MTTTRSSSSSRARREHRRSHPEPHPEGLLVVAEQNLLPALAGFHHQPAFLLFAATIRRGRRRRSQREQRLPLSGYLCHPHSAAGFPGVASLHPIGGGGRRFLLLGVLAENAYVDGGVGRQQDALAAEGPALPREAQGVRSGDVELALVLRLIDGRIEYDGGELSYCLHATVISPLVPNPSPDRGFFS